MSRLFKTNTIGLDITKQIFHIGGKIIPKLIKNVFEVVFKKIANGTSRILSLLEALRLTTANIGRQFLIMPLHTFNTNIIEGILFFIKTFLLWIMNSFVLIWLERRVIHNVWHIWAEIRILSQLEWMKTAISLVSKPITSLQLKMCRSLNRSWMQPPFYWFSSSAFDRCISSQKRRKSKLWSYAIEICFSHVRSNSFFKTRDIFFYFRSNSTGSFIPFNFVNNSL